MNVTLVDYNDCVWSVKVASVGWHDLLYLEPLDSDGEVIYEPGQVSEAVAWRVGAWDEDGEAVILGEVRPFMDWQEDSEGLQGHGKVEQ